MPKPATEHTRRANEVAAAPAGVERDWELDFADASRGLIAELPNGGVVTDAHGRVVFAAHEWRFAAPGTAAPDTVHPSLWRQMQLLGRTGLFEVQERIYQVRGMD